DAIYFGDGAPATEVQPIARLQEAALKAWADASGNLGYGELAGYAPLRELISERMQVRGIRAGAGDIMVTNGSQQGIDLIARLMLDPGDPILVEGPTYIGAMQTFDAYEIDYVVIPMDDEGIDVAALDARLDAMDRKPKLLYTIPAFQNPTGTSISLARREALLDLAERRHLLILEDDPYGELWYGSPPAPALRADHPAVVYLGSFSKTIAPGLRVGWMVPPPEMMDLLAMAKEATDIHSNRIATRTVYHAAEGFLDGHVAMLREFYGARRDVLIEGLTASMPPEIEWNVPDGGFFIWLRLPEAVSANEMLVTAARHDVAYLPGSWFYPLGDVRTNELRLSFSSLPVDRIREGAKRLGHAATDFLRNEECS
ncbi:MAG: PLP-dependent aminotransferase family protein, partial [Thermomicrobiales bacterium]|nr:PLP-dependent aminotransferase family protein [Thermomicrobiales bacterium]